MADPIPLGAIPAKYADELGDDRICLTAIDGTLTWSELDRRTNRRARAFEALGVGQDDLVTMALPNGLEFYETSFALWKLGATPHIVSHKLPQRELDDIVALAEPKLIVGVDGVATPGSDAPARALNISAFSDDAIAIKVAKSWKAMSSGGSTGRPKIIVDHNPSAVDLDDNVLDMPHQACLLNPGPLYHNAPFICAHYGLFRGNHVVDMPRFDAIEALRLIAAHKVKWVMMVPTMMHRIWRLPDAERNAYDLSSLDIVGHVAAPMPVWLKEKWIDWLGPDRVWELYGGTEGTGATWISGTEWLAHKGSVGKCIRDSQVKILDEQGRECPPGEIGEVYMMPAGGPGSTYHYIGAESKTAAGGWETLGDVGWLDEDGYLYLADRRTDMIISGGANIFPAEVEAALAEHPGVDTAVAIGLPDEDLGQIVHAIIYPTPEYGGAINEGALRPFVEERLARYKTPRTYEFVDYSLRDDAGKVRRSQLRQDRIDATQNTGGAGTAP